MGLQEALKRVKYSQVKEMTKIKGWEEISARTYMSEKKLINITEISPKEYIVVLVEGLRYNSHKEL